jgi:hypothetical protein
MILSQENKPWILGLSIVLIIVIIVLIAILVAQDMKCVDTPLLEYPKNLTVTEEFSLINKQFRVNDDNGIFYGQIKSDPRSVDKLLKLVNPENGIQLIAYKKLLAIGTIIEVYTCSASNPTEILIYKIEQIVHVHLDIWKTIYTIKNDKDQLIAETVKTAVIGKEIVITQPGNEQNIYAVLSLPWFNLFWDKWSIKITDTNPIPNGVYALIAAFTTLISKK